MTSRAAAGMAGRAMPRQLLPVIAALAVLVGFMVLRGGSEASVSAHDAPPTRKAELVIAEAPDGGLRVTRPDGGELAVLEVEGDLFAITALRGAAGWLNRSPETGEGHVDLWQDRSNRLFVSGEPDGRLVALDAFGVDNRHALERFFPPRP